MDIEERYWICTPYLSNITKVYSRGYYNKIYLEFKIDLSKQELEDLDLVFTAANEALDFHGDFQRLKIVMDKVWDKIIEYNKK